MTGVADALALCAIPAGAMFVGSFLVYAYAPGRLLISAMQHLSAGIVLGAVAIELVPAVSENNDAGSVVGVCAGFIFGIAAMILIRYMFEPEEDDADKDEAKTSKKSSRRHKSYASISMEATNYRVSMLETSSTNNRSSLGFFTTARVSAQTDRHIVSSNQGSPVQLQFPKFPVTFMIGVCVDGFVDGMTIGIVASTGGSGGLVMALALATEMFFLGLTFSSAVFLQPRKWSIPSILIPPIMIIVGGTVGSVAATGLEDHPAFYVALLAFAVASLLYLVTEELLVEAHSDGMEHHVWYVDLMFFFGFMLSLLIELLAHEDELETV